MNIPIVYEDDWLLIVDKPSGLLTVPSPKKETRTLTSILNYYPCHRLDRETSGLIIYAKTRGARDKMADLFKARKIKKTYLAFVQGRLSRRDDRIQIPIEGQTAVTGLKVLEQRKDFAIIEVTPETGRTNQVRIHLKNIGHPLVGESKFAFRKDYSLKHRRVCLHARTLEFIHPLTGRPVLVDAKLPLDLEKFLAQHP
jgi:RluA family pseudouridine synthase